MRRGPLPASARWTLSCTTCPSGTGLSVNNVPSNTPPSSLSSYLQAGPRKVPHWNVCWFIPTLCVLQVTTVIIGSIVACSSVTTHSDICQDNFRRFLVEIKSGIVESDFPFSGMKGADPFGCAGREGPAISERRRERVCRNVCPSRTIHLQAFQTFV